MNRKLYTKLYRDNPGDFKNPIYVGGYYEKQEGLPAKKFRLFSALLYAAASALLLLMGSGISAPGKALYAALPYAVCYVPAIMGFFAALQAPSDENRIREDTFHNSMEKLQMYGTLGVIFCAAALAGGIAACIAARQFGLPELLWLLAMAGCVAAFTELRILRKKQRYLLQK